MDSSRRDLTIVGYDKNSGEGRTRNYFDDRAERAATEIRGLVESAHEK
jgi:hypothetical protein